MPITRPRNYSGVNPQIVAAFESGREILCTVWDEDGDLRTNRWIVAGIDGCYQDDVGMWWDEATPVEEA